MSVSKLQQLLDKMDAGEPVIGTLIIPSVESTLGFAQVDDILDLQTPEFLFQMATRELLGKVRTTLGRRGKR